MGRKKRDLVTRLGSGRAYTKT